VDKPRGLLSIIADVKQFEKPDNAFQTRCYLMLNYQLLLLTIQSS
jgi:hypothetical protein